METNIKSAKEYWKEKFDEYPNNDCEKLAVAMMQEYEQYVKNLNVPAVMPRLFAISTEEGWNELFWDIKKAEKKLIDEYKKDFPNTLFWVEEVFPS